MERGTFSAALLFLLAYIGVWGLIFVAAGGTGAAVAVVGLGRRGIGRSGDTAALTQGEAADQLLEEVRLTGELLGRSRGLLRGGGVGLNDAGDLVDTGADLRDVAGLGRGGLGDEVDGARDLLGADDDFLQRLVGRCPR